MSRGFSVYLDAIRFLASLIVLFSHVAYTRYSNGDLAWVRDLNLGSDAVILFFVLSGFVIAYSALAGKHTGATYTKARAARLYSVVIPAIAVTLLCDFAGRALNPEAYAGWWYNGEGIWDQVISALTFTSQTGGDTTRLGTNGPFWSVAYEAWYYAAFGAALFLRGWVRALVLFWILAIAGVSIALLAPCWIAGVLLYVIISRRDMNRSNALAGWCLAVAPWAIYAACLGLGVPEMLTQQTFLMTGSTYTPNQIFGFADEFLWNYVLAALFAVHFFGVYTIARQGVWITPRLETSIRWLAGATFSIYLFHYPVLTLLHAMPGYDASKPAHYIGAGGVTLVICFLLAEISERRLRLWKRIVDRVFAAVHIPFKKLRPGAA